MEGYVFLFSRLECNALGQLEIALYYKKKFSRLLLTFRSSFYIYTYL